MGGCATTFRVGAGKGEINVIGHRGASAYAPENTLASYALAADLGADWFELDCMLTKDNQVFIFHDDKLDRVTNGTGLCLEKTLAELKQLDAGSWKDPKYAGERIPTLAEALDLAKARRVGVYVEIKIIQDDSALMNDILAVAKDRPTLNHDLKRRALEMIRANGTRHIVLTEKVIALIREKHMQHQVVIQSFSPVICLLALDRAPELRTELLAMKDDKNAERWPAFLRWAELIKPRGLNAGLDAIDEQTVKRLQAQGMSVAVWTVDEEADMRRLAAWGVNSIIGNKPDVTLRVLRELKRHK